MRNLSLFAATCVISLTAAPTAWSCSGHKSHVLAQSPMPAAEQQAAAEAAAPTEAAAAAVETVTTDTLRDVATLPSETPVKAN